MFFLRDDRHSFLHLPMDDNHFGYKQTKIPKKDTTTK
jgi:hypothetical protein